MRADVGGLTRKGVNERKLKATESYNGRKKKEGQKNMYVVGIGASAGGLQALQCFLEELEEDLNVAYIIVQHLSPEYKSLMRDILARHTAMPVTQIENNMIIEASHVYVIPPNKNLTIGNGKLFLSEFADVKLHRPIDVFLKSMAREYREKSIAIIMSGTGSDGVSGIKSVKEHGGMIMVQEPSDAKFDGMPLNTINTGLSDFVLPTEKMHEEIRHLTRVERTNGSLGYFGYSGENTVILGEMYKLLRKASGIDFTYYRKTTVLRRIERRMTINHMEKPEDYLDLLTEDREEAELLGKEILIGVTKFFREPKSFKVLKERVIPEIIGRADAENPIRIWIAGCSTGEEVYSIAISFAECMEEMDLLLPIKIFATDIDAASVEIASKGVYGQPIMEDVSPARLRKYFVRRGDNYVISKDVRKMVVFAVHNMLQDPPFGRLDLISCRNVMIYFQPILQKRLLAIFHAALKPDGYMALGKSENVNEYKDVFESIGGNEKIYRHAKKVHGDKNDDIYGEFGEISLLNKYLPVHENPIAVEEHSMEPTYLQMLEGFLGPSLIINKKNQIIHTFGDAHKYLVLPTGRVDFSVLTALPEQLKLLVANAIARARREKKQITYTDVPFEIKGEERNLDISVLPLHGRSEKEIDMIAIMAKDVSHRIGRAELESYSIDVAAAQRINDLEGSLSETQKELKASINRLEYVNEELQTSNEELLTANEELQSANEELQSVNEKLMSVNIEYQSKMTELADVNNDISNFLNSSQVGIIFVDSTMNIRKFTEYAAEEFNLLAHDVGRPIHHIAHNFVDARIPEDCKEVLRSFVPVEREVESNNGKCYLMRVSPYKTADNGIKGIVLSIIDITELKQASKQIFKLSAAIEQMSSMLIMTDIDGMIEYVNPKFAEITGYEEPETVGQHIKSFLPEDERETVWKNLQAGKTTMFEAENSRKNEEKYLERASIIPIKDKAGAVINYLKIAEDISEIRDQLTGLPNRNMFKVYMERLLNKERQEKFALMFIDLDEFKTINDTLGHAAGDLVLRETGQRLRSILPQKDYVARYGGDEFLVVLSNMGNKKEIGKIADTILKEFETPLSVGDSNQRVSLSIGIIMSPRDAKAYDVLISGADAAMYAAKAAGKGGYKFFSEEIVDSIEKRMESHKQMREGIEAKEFIPYYQPVFDSETEEIAGFEAVARWKHPDGKVDETSEFIQVAEESGLIAPLAKNILQQACDDLKKWNDLGVGIKVSVNIPHKVFITDNLAQHVENVLRKSRCKAENLILEMPESITGKSSSDTQTIIALKKLGVLLALSDYGSGTGSPAQIAKLPIDIVKLSADYNMGGLSDEKQREIFGAILTFADGMGYTAIVGGIEDREQYRIISELGGKRLQGDYLGEPIPSEEVLEVLLKKGKKVF